MKPLPPQHPKIYHIVHYDRLSSIIADGCLWSDAEMLEKQNNGTAIGMNDIKRRRLTERTLSSHPGLYVGQCVPFYFCPRSVMLYVIHMANHSNLTYRGGQEPIIHLAANFKDAVAWADANNRKWAFTDFNAGAYGCNDYAKPADLEKINWRAIRARIWRGDLMEGKQAEFLMEYAFPWHLIKRIGTCSTKIAEYATNALDRVFHRPRIEVKRDWYY